MALDFLRVKEEDAVRVEADKLRKLISAMFRHFGMSEEDANITADILVLADLYGVDSHGVSHNVKWYVPSLSEGIIKAKPNETIVHETAGTALLDGDGGLGHPTAYRAMKLAMEKARQVGVGVVTVRNSTHIGMVGYYPQMAIDGDMIGIAMTSGSTPYVLTTFGSEPMHSTHPISIGAPANKHPGFLLDMATSVVAAGKIGLASFLDVPIPEGWALDENLQPTTDAKRALKARRMLPLGGSRELGGHKGSGLAAAVQILCGVLSGHGFTAGNEPRTMTHFMLAIDIAAIRPAADFKAMMDDMIDTYHNNPPLPGHDQVYVAGEIEWQMHADRTKNGIPLHHEVVEWLNEMAVEVGVDELS